MHHFRFCPECGGHLTTQPRRSEPEKTALTCTACGFVFFQNAKPTATALIENEMGHVLLVLRAFDPKKGLWDLPGGFLEIDETPDEGLRREVREELGIEIRDIALFGIFMDDYAEGDRMQKTLNIYYRAKIARGKIQPESEIAEVQWFAREALPDRMAFRNNEAVLDAWLEANGHQKKYGSGLPSPTTENTGP